MRNLQTSTIVLALFLVAITITTLKVRDFGLPFTPHQMEEVWSLEAKISFDALQRGAIVNFDIPDKLGKYVVLEEYFVARNYGLNIEKNNGDRQIEWSTRRAKGKQQLYYRIEIAPETNISSPDGAGVTNEQSAPPEIPNYQEPLKYAVEDILSEVRSESANVFTFASQLIVKMNGSTNDSSVSLIKENIQPGSEAWVDRIIYVLAGARITARKVKGVILEDGASQSLLMPWLEIYNGTKWEGFDPATGSKGYPGYFIRWSVGPEPVLEIENGKNAQVSFAISKYTQPLIKVAQDRAALSESWLAELLLFELPVSTQNVYRTLLMIPIGALIVAVMRTVIGIPTLGTFMPILIAVAFRETELALGIFLFVLITVAGLIMRFYLERLQLLLVPRLCAILIVVILMMLSISLLSANWGLMRGFSIALFPIVILTMVIEHMSVVWEESGPLATIKEGLGSLLVAVLGYLAMINEYLTHIVFLFPEVLLIFLAIAIMLGRYTGYRLSELFRFRDVVEGAH